MNKRGQGLSITAIILIILGILVLVVVIIGFIMGWDKIAPWIKPSNNVQDVVQKCQVACSTGAKYDFCSVKRKLVTEDGTFEDINCNFLAKIKKTYGIQECPSIACDNIPVSATTEDVAKESCKKDGDKVDYLVTEKLIQYICTATDIN